MQVDLSVLPSGADYEATYRHWIGVFEQVAKVDIKIPVRVESPPWSWVPLLQALGAETMNARMRFVNCPAVKAAWLASSKDRTALEVLAGFRPEVTDALWKCDMQWHSARTTRLRFNGVEDEFIVTTNGAFYRQNVIDFMNEVMLFTPKVDQVILVPCSADKPYPSALHKKVKALAGDDWYLATVTGTLGVCPEGLWPKMPNYDAGMPNKWRAQEAVRAYFARVAHRRIVVYSDFYSMAIQYGLQLVGGRRWDVAVPPDHRADYLPLDSEEYLLKLAAVLRGERVLFGRQKKQGREFAL